MGKTIFTITDGENTEFDSEHEDRIMAWMEYNLHRITPYIVIEKVRLRNEKIEERDLLHHLRRFKEKTPSLNNITRNMLINLPQNCMNTILEIFNATLAAGYFPDKFKKAKVIFIDKPGKDPTNTEHYRPISPLDVMGKLLEKIINYKLKRYINILRKANP